MPPLVCYCVFLYETSDIRAEGKSQHKATRVPVRGMRRAEEAWGAKPVAQAEDCGVTRYTVPTDAGRSAGTSAGQP